MHKFILILFFGIISSQVLLTQLLFSQEPGEKASDPVRIFLIAGQSNAINIHTDAEDLPAALIDTSVRFYYHCGTPPDKNIPFFSTSGNKWTKLSIQRQIPYVGGSEYFFGPEMTLVNSLGKLYKNLAVIKCAYGGSNLAADWKRGAVKGNMLYKIMLDQVKNACHLLDSSGITYSFAGFFWIQGERDASSQSYASAYLTNLSEFIKGIRTDLKSPGLPFIISRLPSGQPYTYLSQVRSAQENICRTVEKTKWIDTDSLELGSDFVHFTSSGVTKLGTLLASGYLDLIPSNIKSTSEHTINGYELRQNYPNPFNSGTYITYSLPERSSVKLTVYDILGREVSVLVNKQMEAGEYKAGFEGSFLPGGVYIYSIRAGQFSDSKKLLLLK